MFRTSIGAAAAALMATFALSSAFASPPDSESDREAGSANPQASMKYDSTNAQPDRFEGTVVCVTPDQKIPTSASQCTGGSEVLALSVEESDAVHPIVAADDKLRDRLRAHVGDDVIIEGKRYEGSGMIMASTVLSEEAAK
jgi:hypothetical protein